MDGNIRSRVGSAGLHQTPRTGKAPAEGSGLGLGSDLGADLDLELDNAYDLRDDVRLDTKSEAVSQARSEYPDDYLATDFDFEIQSCRSSMERLNNLKAEVRDRAEHECADMNAEIRRLKKKLDKTREAAHVEMSRLNRALSAERAKHDVLMSKEV